jgi:serine protease Do
VTSSEARREGARVVLVSEIQPGSPAETAGLKPGDQIVRVGETSIATSLDIERGLLDLRPGQKTEVVVRRGGRDQAMPLVLQPVPHASPDAAEQVWRLLGLKVAPIGKEYVAAYSPNLKGGLLVQTVSPGGAGARAMIQRGDILVGLQVGSRLLETIRTDNVVYVLNQPEITRSQSLPFYIVRRTGIHEGVLNLTENLATKR